MSETVYMVELSDHRRRSAVAVTDDADEAVEVARWCAELYGVSLRADGAWWTWGDVGVSVAILSAVMGDRSTAGVWRELARDGDTA